MAGLKALIGETVKGKDGDVQVDTFASSDTFVGIYFSAHWCPPCRGFTPMLSECYKAIKGKGKKFEVVFVSSDRDQKSFDDYYGEMPWLTIGFGSDKKDFLGKKFEVRGIPTLILVNGETGEVVATNGREKVANDPEGNDFPWTS